MQPIHGHVFLPKIYSSIDCCTEQNIVDIRPIFFFRRSPSPPPLPGNRQPGGSAARSLYHRTAASTPRPPQRHPHRRRNGHQSKCVFPPTARQHPIYNWKPVLGGKLHGISIGRGLGGSVESELSVESSRVGVALFGSN